MHQAAFYQELDALYARGNQQAVEGFLLQAADDSCAQGDTPSWIAALSELGSFYRGTSRYEQAVACFVQVCDLVAQARGPGSADYAVAVNNLGGAYRMMGDTQRALQTFEKALAFYSKPADRQGFYYAALLNNMALAYQQAGKLAAARHHMLEALTVLKEIPGSHIEVATTMANLAVLYQKEGQLAQAKQMAEEALDIYARPENAQNPHHAAALHLAAGLCYLAKDYPKAERLYRQAMGMTEKTFGKNADYAKVCESLAAVHRAAGHPQKAQDLWQEAQAVYTALGLEKPALRVQGVLQRLGEDAT